MKVALMLVWSSTPPFNVSSDSILETLNLRNLYLGGHLVASLLAGHINIQTLLNGVAQFI